MTPDGGGTCEGSKRLVVAVAATPEPQPVDATSSAVHRLRIASFNTRWHLLLDDVFTACGWM